MSPVGRPAKSVEMRRKMVSARVLPDTAWILKNLADRDNISTGALIDLMVTRESRRREKLVEKKNKKWKASNPAINEPSPPSKPSPARGTILSYQTIFGAIRATVADGFGGVTDVPVGRQGDKMFINGKYCGKISEIAKTE